MKNYSWLNKLVVCCAFGLMYSASYAQVQVPRRTLTEAQLSAIVKPDFAQCQANSTQIDPAYIIPASNAREFPAERIAKTLHGIWEGKIVGDTNDLGIDYFWVIDTKLNEGLIVALRNGKQTVPSLTAAQAATAPKLTYLLCAHEGYIPAKDYHMIHVFTKVNDNIDDAAQILEKATGVKLSAGQPLSAMWQTLLASGYFTSMPAVAFAGALFKPVTIGRLPSATGPAGYLLQWNSEYRGGGSTSIKYVSGVPLNGVEHGEFVGTTTKSGDFLVSSPGNGKTWKVEASLPSGALAQGSTEVFPASCYDLAFDSVTLGPLQGVDSPTLVVNTQAPQQPLPSASQPAPSASQLQR
jgi:hypothetical protein